MLGSARFGLKGKVVMVTGANRGLGRVIAQACAASGADIVLGARNRAEATKVAEECRAFGHQRLRGGAGINRSRQYQ